MTWFLVDDVATIVQVHPRTVQRWCRERRIPHIRIGRGIRFTEEQVREIVEAYSCAVEEQVEVDAPNPFFRERMEVVPMTKPAA